MIRSATALASRGRSSGSTRQAVLRQGDQLGLGAAGVEPGQGVGRVAVSAALRRISPRPGR